MTRRLRRGRPAAGLAAVVAAVSLVAVGAPAAAAGEKAAGGTPRTVLADLSGPRGLAVDGGRTYVSEADGTVTEVKRSGRRVRTSVVGKVPVTGVAPALAVGRGNRVWAVTGENPDVPVDATLYLLEKGKPVRTVRDIGAYQQGDPDPYDLEDEPTTSNPFGLAALPDGGVLIADAAGNDLLRVSRDGKHIVTVARLKPRTVPVPEGLPPGFPPAGTLLPTEAVATSVTVGSDGYYYVGELRGFPGTPGYSQIWRIHPRSVNAVCDPAAPHKGACRRHADGFTSIVDLGAGHRGTIYVAQLADKGWLQLELDPATADPIGSIIRLDRSGRRTELAPGTFALPGGVETGKRGEVLVVAPALPVAPGALYEFSARR
jgi:hypothetical protein